MENGYNAVINLGMQVWLCLGVSFVVMTLTLTFVSGFYRKYLDNRTNESITISLMNFGFLGRNAIFIWAHLTNRCDYYLIKFYLK